jgi:hypothetical protein
MFFLIVFFGATCSLILMNGIYLNRFRVFCIDLYVRKESIHIFFCCAKVQFFIGSLQSGIIYSTPSIALCGFVSVSSRAPAS